MWETLRCGELRVDTNKGIKQIFLIQLSVDGHLGWFHTLAIANWAANKHRHEKNSLGCWFCFTWVNFMEGIVEPMADLFSGLQGITKLSSIMAVLAYIPTNSGLVSLFPHIFTIVYVFWFYNDSHSNWSDMKLVVFLCIFLIWCLF